MESPCRRLSSHLPTPGLGTEGGSRQGKQADNQVGPEPRTEKERMGVGGGGGGAARYVKAPKDSNEARGKGMVGFCLCVCASISSSIKESERMCVCFQKDQQASACCPTRNLIRTTKQGEYIADMCQAGVGSGIGGSHL